MARDARPVIPADGALTVFTDGSSLSGPRRGGVGIRYVYTDREGIESSWDSDQVGFTQATVNQMEVLAVTTALKEIQGRRFPPEVFEVATKIDVYTDSRYMADNLNTAIFEWPRNRWMTRAGAPVQNAELWKDLVRELARLRKLKRVDVKWGKGHSRDNPHNKVADRLAKESARRAVRPPLTSSSVRRKKSAKATEIGSVEMIGQRLTIRIVSAEYLRTQRVSKYRYEVMSKGSPYAGNLDIAYAADASLRAGHTYYVTMGRDAGYPTIARLHREVTPKLRPAGITRAAQGRGVRGDDALERANPR